MATQRETNQTNQTTQSTKEKSYIVVDFLNLQKDNFSFGQPKPNKYGGLSISLKYEGKNLYVRYPRRVTPFGVSTNKEKPKVQGDPEKLTGFTTTVSCHKEYAHDPLYQKAQELDEMFINACVNNSQLWGLGGSKTKPISRDVIEGYDDKGDKGKWKRLLKWSYKVDQKTQEKQYLEYAPRLELAISANIKGEPGKETAEFTVPFFNHEGTKISEKVTDSNIDEILPKFSELALVANWGNLTQGTYGCTLKPRAEQIRIYPRDELPNDECLINDDDNGDGELNSERPSFEESKMPTQMTKAPSPDLDGDGDDDVAYTEPEAPAPAKPTTTRRVAARVTSK